MKAKGERSKGGRPRKTNSQTEFVSKPELDALGVTPKQAMAARVSGVVSRSGVGEWELVGLAFDAGDMDFGGFADANGGRDGVDAAFEEPFDTGLGAMHFSGEDVCEVGWCEVSPGSIAAGDPEAGDGEQACDFGFDFRGREGEGGATEGDGEGEADGGSGAWAWFAVEEAVEPAVAFHRECSSSDAGAGPEDAAMRRYSARTMRAAGSLGSRRSQVRRSSEVPLTSSARS